MVVMGIVGCVVVFAAWWLVFMVIESNDVMLVVIIWRYCMV